ncbi:MAG: tRNA (adenosine(37)-N6)-threonylcarbamoyltransferase complex ATPase subunit type 1 TsaE, partial [Candidatus Binatia bacterium]
APRRFGCGRPRYETRSAAETAALGERVGRLLRNGDVVGLSGALGAGKTSFVRGLARGLALDPDVVYSPSFTLVAEYPGPLTLHHIDLYRLGEPVSLAEAEEIGLREYLDPAGVTAIEWSRKLEEAREVFSLSIDIEIGDAERRVVRIEAGNERGEEILRSLVRDRPAAE